jgi:tetratricopeptide (TPR) repeat protein
VGDVEQAEKLYKEANEKNPDDVLGVRRLVQFYIKVAREGPPAQFMAQINKAVPYLDQIVKKTEKASDAANLRNLAWARRTQAEIMAASGSYKDLMAALNLIQQNARNGKLLPEDLMMMIDLSAKRPDPASRNRTIQLLEQLRQQRPLSSREQLLMGQLLERAGNWTQARDLMTGALSTQNNDPETLVAFTRSLVAHGENEEARRWLDQLDQLLSKASPRVVEQYKPISHELRARMLVNMGQSQQAIAVLDQLVPKPLPPSQLYRLERVAMLLEEMGQFDAAEKMLDEYMQQEPRGTIAMAAFLGRRGNLDKSFALLNESRNNQSATQIMPCALESLRLFPDQQTPERYRMVEEWGKAGLEKEVNATPQIKLLIAELYDMQGRYDEVEKLYREVLADKRINEAQSAIVKNNLAFVLALTGKEPAEALRLIGEAMQVIGPNSDLLDTRGLANLAQGNVQQAVADFKLAAGEAPSVSKYVHLAQAEKQANNVAGARDAMAQAEKLGIQTSKFTPKEKENYEKLAAELQ